MTKIKDAELTREPTTQEAFTAIKKAVEEGRVAIIDGKVSPFLTYRDIINGNTVILPKMEVKKWDERLKQ